MVEQFTREQFEAALPVSSKTGKPLWEYLNIQKGEHVYVIPVVGTNKRIVIRSSVHGNLSAPTGGDSIRHWIEYFYKDQWRPLKKADKAYTTRVNGWEGRLTTVLRELYKDALKDSKTNPGKAIVTPPPPPHTEPTAATPSNPFGFLGEDNGGLAGLEDEKEPQAKRVIVKVASTASLNPQQQAVVDAPINKPLRVPAPPGAGKTHTLTYRYQRLLQEGVDPASIIAVTFSRTMADELLSRIAGVNPEVLDGEGQNNITTLHALCYRILNIEGIKRNVPQMWKIKQFLQDEAEQLWPYSKSRPGWQELTSAIDNAKLRCLTSDEDMKLYGHIQDSEGRNVGMQLHKIRKAFDEWLERNRFITFADMLYLVDLKLRDDHAFRERWQERIQYVIVDEAQDTSMQAMRILSTLAAPQNNVTIIGDVDQLLYRFAGATPEANMYEGFEERYPNGNTVTLEINYRSTKEIVERCHRLIQYNYKVACPVCGGSNSLCSVCDGKGVILDAPYEAKYLKPVQPRPDAPQGNPIEFAQYYDATDEGQGVVQKIQQLLDAGRNPGNIFIGVRTRAQTAYFEGPLVKAKIPYINLAGSSFFGMKHVKDVIAYLRLAVNGEDSDAFQRVYNIASQDMVYPFGKHKGDYCNHRFLGKAFLSACGRKPNMTTMQQATKFNWQAGIKDLEQFITAIRYALTESLERGLEVIIESYAEYLKVSEGITSEDASSSKFDDLETVVDIARDFTEPKDFIEYALGAEEAATAAKDGNWDGHVVISTIHRLKGTERPVVFGCGISEGYDKKGEPVGLLPHTYSLRLPPIKGVLPIGEQGRVEDERDMAYVLISRAKEEVYLSSIQKYRKVEMYPSRFIGELGLLEQKGEIDENR